MKSQGRALWLRDGAQYGESPFPRAAGLSVRKSRMGAEAGKGSGSAGMRIGTLVADVPSSFDGCVYWYRSNLRQCRDLRSHTGNTRADTVESGSRCDVKGLAVRITPCQIRGNLWQLDCA
jgi:hypothetical protein